MHYSNHVEHEQQPLELERAINWLSLVSNPNADEAILLIHGFGANTNHWRFNASAGQLLPTIRHRPTWFRRSDHPGQT